MATKKTSNRLRSAPDLQERDAALDAFAMGALAQENEDAGNEIYSWEKPYVRDDVMKQVLLKMPEPLYLKLKHITNYTPYNMTSFILEKITPEIEKEIARLTGR